MKKNFGMGWLKDPKDTRDYNIRQLSIPRKIELPDSYIVYTDTIIYDQGTTPKCVAHASSGIKTDQEFLQYGDRYKFDPDWLYAKCKLEDGIPNSDGTYPRVACKIMQENGMKLADKKLNCFQTVTGVADLKWRILNYYRIDESNSDQMIKQILLEFGSIMAASNWYSNWSEKFGVFPKPQQPAYGGHAYRVIGWAPNGWIVANSWGTQSWGNSGKAVMPYNIFRNYVLPEGDVWKIIDFK